MWTSCDGEGRKDKGGGEGSRSKNSCVGKVVMYVCMHACMYVCMYGCMHACMYVCMHGPQARYFFSTSGGGGVCVMKTERYLAT